MEKLSVLFLCTGNSCRSIMAEALLNHLGDGNFLSYSAGSNPTGEVHPLSIKTIEDNNVSLKQYRSKSWDEFSDKKIDIVVTVCDSASRESCPIFPGNPRKIHWSIEDPAKFKGSEKEIEEEFVRIFTILKNEINKLITLSHK